MKVEDIPRIESKGEQCTFTDVTCYIPECGGRDHYDPKLVAQRARESEERLK